MSIEIHELHVRYGAQQAVRGLSLSVPEGSMFGLLGPNGAGKSSTIRCIATTQAPSSGRILVGGHDIATHGAKVRELLGVVPQGLAVYDGLPVEQNLRIFGGLYGLAAAKLKERVEWGLELAQLGSHRSKKAAELSGGMKRRLNIAAALLHDPRILIFDEPTAGVDPQSRNHIFDTIRRLHSEGRTIVYTTHYMEEVEALCDRVAIVDHGALVVCDSLATLLSRARPTSFRLRMRGPGEVASLRAQLAAAGIELESLEGEGQSLESVFLELTGRALRDAS
jgi:ABC-2 type transport system ATP-binding protein